MRNTLKLATLTALVVALHGCAAGDLLPWKRNGKGSPEFQRLLSKGKSPAGMATTTPRGFGLVASPNVVAMDIDPGDGRASFVTYDTGRMPDVQRSGLKAAALAHVGANTDLFGVPTEELRETQNSEVEDGNGNVTVSFQRFVEGIPVDSSLLQVGFAPMGKGVYRIRDVLNHTYGEIKLSAGEKLGVGDSSLAAAVGLDQLVELDQDQVIYPRVNQNGVYEHTLATRLHLEDAQTGERFAVIAKADGEILEAASNRTHVIHQVLVELWDRTPGSNKRVPVPLSYVTVQAKVTDKDGKADLTLGQNLVIPLGTAGNGSRTTIRSVGVNGVPSITIPTVANTDKTTFPMPADVPTLASLNAYVKVNVVADFVRQYLPNNPMVARQIQTNTNTNDICNAFYDGQTLNFFRRSNANDQTACENTALIDDVVYHEWGHGLDDLTGPAQGITDGAYSEGIGDILSMLITGSNNLAPGFLLQNPANGIRNLENKKKYPGDLDPQGEVHNDGEIIGATFWDVRKGLVARYGVQDGNAKLSKLFLNSLMTTTRYLDSYQAVLRLDDDDNNPATRSPNYCLITAAYAAHGFATAEPNCVDAGATLNLAISSMANNSSITLYGSSDAQTAKIGVCLGTPETCLASKKVDVDFVDDRVTPDGVKIYKSDKAFEVTDGMTVTIFAFNPDGSIRGSRGAKFTKQAP